MGASSQVGEVFGPGAFDLSESPFRIFGNGSCPKPETFCEESVRPTMIPSIGLPIKHHNFRCHRFDMQLEAEALVCTPFLDECESPSLNTSFRQDKFCHLPDFSLKLNKPLTGTDTSSANMFSGLCRLTDRTHVLLFGRMYQSAT